MKDKFLYITLGVFLCLLSGALFLGYGQPHETEVAEAARRIIVQDNELYLASDAIGSKKLTTNQDIKLLFGEKNGVLLVGKGYEELEPGNPNTRGTRLSLFNEDGTEIRKINDKLAQYALFDKSGDNIIYLTPDGKIFQQETQGGAEKKIADHASLPSVSPDGKFITYKKMPADWTPGQYTDGAPGIVVTNIETGEEKIVASEEADHASFWSPDGEYIFFYGDNGFGMDSLHMMNSDGSERTLLGNVGKDAYVPGQMVPSISEPPIISSDGKFFIYESDREIWLNEIDLVNKKLIRAKRIGYGTSPQWIEEGKTLSIVFGGNGKSQNGSLIAVDVDGNIINK